MTTPHTEHTDHPGRTDPTEPTGKTQQQTQQQSLTDPIQTTITFNGLMVFRPDQANKTCDVGVLHARDQGHPHILQIEIEPDPRTGSGKWTLDSDQLERYVQAGNIRWKFEVVKGATPEPAGIVVNTLIPPDRHNPPTPTREKPLGFGWLVNLESGEFHSGRITRTRGKLKPIIELTKGELFTSCLTNSIDVKQGANTRYDFGFIAGAIDLRLTPADGDAAVLYFMDQAQVATVIFRLPNINQVSYKVYIRNTPMSGPSGGHFHQFYDRLFQGVGGHQRFDLQLCYPPIPASAAGCAAQRAPDPDPFKCGGIAVGGRGPLE